jgi:hypothetical protein
MSDSYLVRRNRRYHFRIRVPKHLIDIVGSAEIRRTLLDQLGHRQNLQLLQPTWLYSLTPQRASLSGRSLPGHVEHQTGFLEFPLLDP